MPTSQKMFAGALWFLLIAVIILFWFSVFRFSYNFPYYDDFENIVRFVNDYIKADSIQTKLSLLFEQNFEHRVIFSKSVTLLQYFVTGQVNIKWLIILGDLSLVGILILLFNYFRQKQLSLIGLVAAACLLFQAQHYEDSISWATCSLQHAPCIFFSLWSFYLALNKRNPYLSGGLAVLALFTSANGLSSIVIWLIIIFLNTSDKKKIIIPASLLALITIIHIATLEIYSGSVLTHATSNIGPKIILFLSFAGQVADPNVIGSIYPSVFLGLAFIAPLLVAIFISLSNNSKAVSSLQWFCIAGIITLTFVDFLIVFARGTDADPAGYRMDRYKIYAALFAVLAVAFYDGYWSVLKFAVIPRTILAGAAFLFCITSYYVYYGNINSYRKTIEANHYNDLWSSTIYYPIIYWDAKTGEYMPNARVSFLKDAVEAQEISFEKTNWQTISDQISVQGSESTSEIVLSNADWRSKEPVDKLYAVAIDHDSLKPAYLFTVEGSYQKAAKMFLTHFERPLAPGFSCRIYKTKLKKGTYDIYLLPIKKGRITRPYKLRRIII